MRRHLLVVAAAFGAWVGYANPWAQFPLAALALPAGLAALGLDAESPWTAFKRAWVAGTLAALGCLYWVYWPVHRYGGVHWLLALPMPVFLAMIMAVYFGLFGMVAQVAGKRMPPLQALPCLGLAWTIMELAMATLLSGFPWLTLSAAFVRWPITTQLAAYIGGHGLSGVLALIATGVVLAYRSKVCAVISLATALLVCGLGWLRMHSYSESTPPRTVAIVQGNIDQALKWDPAYQQHTVMKYISLSRSVLAENPELIVWPETSMPFYFQNDTPLRTPILDFLHATNASLVLGSPAYELNPVAPPTLFNRVFLLNGSGSAPRWYDKEHLVPFGEYMPFAEWLPFQKLVSGIGDFAPGRNEARLAAGDVILGALICYEAIFAGLAQDRVFQGANLLVNVSNDAWFGDTSAPLQHLQLAALRAIEQGRWMVRSTNTGNSAFIDPLGRIKEAGPQFANVAAVGQVHLRTEPTLFHRLYWALLAAVGGLAALFAYLVIRGNRNAHTHSR